MSEVEGELLSLKWNNHRSTFLQVVGDLRSKASFTDATLACNGKFYPVHRLVLSSCSDYFSAIFDHTTCKSPVVVLKDIESKNLEYLLDYMYIGEVNVRQHELGALVGAAECLKIKGLAVPDDSSSQVHDNSSKNKILFRNRSSSPPNKRKRFSKYLEHAKANSSSKKNTNDCVSSNSSETNNNTQSDIVTNIKYEPCDPDEALSRGNQIISQALRNSPNHKQNVDADGNVSCNAVEKEEAFEVEESSPSGEGNLIYDTEDQSWKCDDGFHSDLVSFMTRTSTSEPSCSSTQQDELMVRRKIVREHSSPFSGKISGEGARSAGTERGEEDIWSETERRSQQQEESNCSNDSYSSLLRTLVASDMTTTTTTASASASTTGLSLPGGDKETSRYFCQFCDHSTMYKGNLIRHIRIHTGVKPFKCRFCECRYSDQTMLRNHYKSHHSHGGALPPPPPPALEFNR